jgi:hypothetical protein
MSAWADFTSMEISIPQFNPRFFLSLKIACAHIRALFEFQTGQPILEMVEGFLLESCNLSVQFQASTSVGAILEAQVCSMDLIPKSQDWTSLH